MGSGERRLERYGDLLLEGDLGFLRRQWRVQKRAWIAMAAFVIAAALGAAGSGPLSRGHARDARAKLGVDYSRITRTDSQSELTISMPPSERETVVTIDRAYVDRVRLDAVVPEPSRQESDGDVVRFVVNASPRPRTLVVELTPRSPGHYPATITAGDANVHIEQWVLP